MLKGKIKPKKCKCGCGEYFIPTRPMQPVSDNMDCKYRYAIKMAEKSKAAREKKERANIRERKQKIKPRSQHIADTQKEVNRWRRLEELSKGRGCISCGRSRQEVEKIDGWKPGGVWDAGHFMSVGSHPELRFEPKNIWLQCKSCNAGSGKYARKARTVSENYEINLVNQEGRELVDWLKGPHSAKHYTIDELLEIKKHAKEMVKKLDSRDSSF